MQDKCSVKQDLRREFVDLALQSIAEFVGYIARGMKHVNLTTKILRKDESFNISLTGQQEENMVAIAQKRAFGIFPSRKATEQAINELKASGFPMEKVSVIAKQAEENDQLSGVTMSDRVGDRDVDATGAVGDAVTSATWGTILAGLTSLALPGIGPILAAGSLGVGLLTGVAGTALTVANSGGLVKALTELGVGESPARTYSDRLIQGDYLVILDGTDEEINRAGELLRQQDIQNWGIFG